MSLSAVKRKLIAWTILTAYTNSRLGISEYVATGNAIFDHQSPHRLTAPLEQSREPYCLTYSRMTLKTPPHLTLVSAPIQYFVSLSRAILGRPLLEDPILD